MRIRRLAVGATSFCALGLATIMVAWACTTSADMTLGNAGTTTWDPGSSGVNFSECPATEFVSTNHCKRPVNVTGSQFLNSNTSTSVGTVDLYWLDAPFFAAGAGTQGQGEQIAAEVCTTKGVLLASGVTVSNLGAFSTQVNVPPTATTYADNTMRPRNVYYGANAVCAVWFHDNAGTADDHYSGFGNQYTIYPI